MARQGELLPARRVRLGPLAVVLFVAFASWTAAAAAKPKDLPPLVCRDENGQPLEWPVVSPSDAEAYEKPVLIERVEPKWPEGEARVRGAIAIEAIIDERGAICAARLLRGAGDPAAQAFLEAFRRWRFRPARFHGKPVPVSYGLWVHIGLQ